ncbi:MAG: hypothetical protein FWD58_04620 [Firmicutes bacterium]|nr:hypothetical protein [Bacillota bacterium]
MRKKAVIVFTVSLSVCALISSALLFSACGGNHPGGECNCACSGEPPTFTVECPCCDDKTPGITIEILSPEAFIGTYNSTWVEGAYSDESVNYKTPSFLLNIKSDKTYVLTSLGADEERIRSGTWVGNGSNGNYGLICFAAESTSIEEYVDSQRIERPATRNTHFTLSLLDDGRILASSGAFYGSPIGGSDKIIIFEKAG